MAKRKEPKHADFYDWRRFEQWADANGIGTHYEDWGAWWECWKGGYSAAKQE